MTGFSIATMRHRVTLERPVAAPDGAGGETVAWEPVRSVWARVEPVAKRRESQGGRRLHPAGYRITIRRWTDVAPFWRVVFEDRPLTIDSIAEKGKRRLYLMLECIGGLGE